MLRPIWFRALIAVWGLWFATALTQPAGMFECTMHAGHGSHAMSHGDHHAQSTHVVHDASAMTHGAHTAPAPTPQNEVCTCLGECCTAMPVSSPEPAVALAVLATIAVPTPMYAPIAWVIPQREYLLPFANGPPIRLAPQSSSRQAWTSAPHRVATA